MRHIILASHHRFAAGLADTMEYIGNIEGLDVICAYVDETPLEDQVAEVFGYPPFDGGDRRIQSLNYVNTDIVDQYQMEKIERKGMGANGEQDKS